MVYVAAVGRMRSVAMTVMANGRHGRVSVDGS